jgi:hypothetical protein
MRKIEQEMIHAFINRGTKKNKNDHVVTSWGTTAWYYRGNLIAVLKGDSYCQINDATWRSKTTKSRLNAILYTLKPDTRISQKDYTWYINDKVWQGSLGFYY